MPDTIVRNRIVERLERDLVGPRSPDERLRDRPSDVYLTGILFPQRTPVGADEDDALTTGDDEGESTGTASEEEAPALFHAMRPASAGLSFAVRAAVGSPPRLNLRIACGTYVGVDLASEADGEKREGQAIRRPEWQRTGHQVTLEAVTVHRGSNQEIRLAEHGISGLMVFFRSLAWGEDTLITVALVNEQEVGPGEGRRVAEERSFFQTRLEVRPGIGTEIHARPSGRSGEDEDARAGALLYRDAREYAVGHTCSAEWDEAEDGTAARVRTSWIPAAVVPGTSSAGHTSFRVLRDRADGLQPLSPSWLADAGDEELARALSLLPEAYDHWILLQEARLSDLPEEFSHQGRVHLEECRRAAARMRRGVALIGEPEARLAFQLANRAMEIQRSWLNPDEDSFLWRPFQLGFLLLALESVAKRGSEDRDVMDLLWFPTGGGKTEAYLSLIAFTLFYRRVQAGSDSEHGAGVGVIMRYTLRLLTAQQFQRASALILACEFIRRGGVPGAAAAERLGSVPFSIGMWVGGDATPNDVATAERALNGNPASSPAQLERCPACTGRLTWRVAAGAVRVRCSSADCSLARLGPDLPVWTVDEDVYRETPSLIIGTADKFAQIVRSAESGSLFNRGTPCAPPDLIIQDELHLISGPLGTMAGLYEVAIDTLCSSADQRPKVIGSTATIRRAEAQIRALFDRKTAQFPPPGLDASDSGFAITDPAAPGRLYLGVTTAGRSAKFTLQGVSASLLQSAADPALTDPERDPYWTLVTYFNSLRELGGALVLMQDDVAATMAEYAARRGETQRMPRVVVELTSRVSQLELRDRLHELTYAAPHVSAIDVLLATNMISVGVDVPRLGLMVVNGQPKGIAEYIQATSRVGRSDAPGLIITVYNSAKARDRSHYETFSTWHQMLYREVEATSVTPFASRARDRALHAPLIAVLRHMEISLAERPVLTERGRRAARGVANRIIQRAKRIDPEEVESVRQQLDQLLDDWEARGALRSYWNDHRPSTSLLMSAEKAAALRAAGRLTGEAWPTPNSLRNVDPGVPFVAVERLRPDEVTDAQA